MNEVSPRIGDGEKAAAALGTVVVALEMIEVGAVMVAMSFFLGDKEGKGSVFVLVLKG